MTKQTILVSVTQDHINAAYKAGRSVGFSMAHQCVIGQAVAPLFPGEQVDVQCTYVAVEDLKGKRRLFDLPPEAQRVTRLHEKSYLDRVKPFDFELSERGEE